jgi:hypothetical protein
VLGLHGEVGDLLEAHRGGGLTGGVVSTGAWLGLRGIAVSGSVRWRWSIAHGLRWWPGHGQSLVWCRRSRRTTGEAWRWEALGGRQKAVVASVLGVFSRRKLLVLGRPSDGEVDLMGGALVMGGGGRCRHDVRRSGAEAWMRSRVRE